MRAPGLPARVPSMPHGAALAPRRSYAAALGAVRRLKQEEAQAHKPKVEMDKRHKVILFGRIYRGKSEEEEDLASDE